MGKLEKAEQGPLGATGNPLALKRSPQQDMLGHKKVPKSHQHIQDTHRVCH